FGALARRRLLLVLLGEDREDIRLRFAYFFDPPQKGGGVVSLDLRPVTGPFDYLGQRIVPIPAKHGILDIIGFRFGDFVYVTDASLLPPESLNLIMGCRTLVLNALRIRKHSTHFNLEEAVEVAQRAGAERTWFVHMAHELEHAATNATLPQGIELACDGLQFEFQPAPATSHPSRTPA
ncbi:MBL fold metallo-hydrolase, partial [Candidatus Poribacteria bacterium]|nr:MBL fold metallo-hydrolase [Candidatus Poribacteria bacterium]